MRANQIHHTSDSEDSYFSKEEFEDDDNFASADEFSGNTLTDLDQNTMPSERDIEREERKRRREELTAQEKGGSSTRCRKTSSKKDDVDDDQEDQENRSLSNLRRNGQALPVGKDGKFDMECLLKIVGSQKAKQIRQALAQGGDDDDDDGSDLTDAQMLQISKQMKEDIDSAVKKDLFRSVKFISQNSLNKVCRFVLEKLQVSKTMNKQEKADWVRTYSQHVCTCLSTKRNYANQQLRGGVRDWRNGADCISIITPELESEGGEVDAQKGDDDDVAVGDDNKSEAAELPAKRKIFTVDMMRKCALR